MNYVSDGIRKNVMSERDPSKRKKCSWGGAMGISSTFVLSCFLRWMVITRGIIMLFFIFFCMCETFQKRLRSIELFQNQRLVCRYIVSQSQWQILGEGRSRTVSPPNITITSPTRLSCCPYTKVLRSITTSQRKETLISKHMTLCLSLYYGSQLSCELMKGGFSYDYCATQVTFLLAHVNIIMVYRYRNYNEHPFMERLAVATGRPVRCAVPTVLPVGVVGVILPVGVVKQT